MILGNLKARHDASGSLVRLSFNVSVVANFFPSGMITFLLGSCTDALLAVAWFVNNEMVAALSIRAVLLIFNAAASQPENLEVLSNMLLTRFEFLFISAGSPRHSAGFQSLFDSLPPNGLVLVAPILCPSSGLEHVTLVCPF